MTEKLTGGDLYSLWKISDAWLPRIADVFYDANRSMAGVSADGALSEVTAYSWTLLHDELQRMYAQVGDTVLAGADGVRQAMRDFVDADLGNMADLEAARTGEATAPVAGSDDDPGKPIIPGR